MNSIEYISSGILESYVLGLVSPQEKQEVECMSKIYPEIKSELNALQGVMVNYASSFEKQPPAHLKAKIFAQMHFDEEKTNIVLEEKNVIVKPLWPKLSIAAALFFGIMSIWSVQQNFKLKADLLGLKEKNEGLFKESTFKENLLSLYKNPDIENFKLKGVEKSPKSEVMLFWDKNKQEVNLLVESLPKTPSGKQYQLWCIIDGKPVDMGVLDKEFENKVLTIKAPKGSVAAFAITLEKQGGSPTPTLEEMYVIGNV